MGCLDFVKEIKFDVNNRFLIGYGGLKFFTCDLREGKETFGKVKTYELHDYYYE